MVAALDMSGLRDIFALAAGRATALRRLGGVRAQVVKPAPAER